MPFTYEYPHPAVTVDCIIFALHEDDLKVLLIQRNGDPFKGCWALPGGFVEIDENIETAALRELNEETGLEKVFLEQLYTFGEPKRDPRERVISVVQPDFSSRTILSNFRQQRSPFFGVFPLNPEIYIALGRNIGRLWRAARPNFQRNR